MKVPPGRSRIAHRFNGGCQPSEPVESRRDERKSWPNHQMPCRPSGTLSVEALNPRLKP
jgi:hypothetical protein